MSQLTAPQQSLLDRVLEHMVRLGHAATPQRRLVAQELLTSPRALTARQLSDSLNDQGERVGVMTVYRTLALLAEIGAAYTLHDHISEGAEAHYVFCSDRHHHLICSACWGVWEVEGCGLSEAQSRVGDRLGFQVQSHSLDYYGLCAHCAGAAAGRV